MIPKKVSSLVVLRRNGSVLLGMKKRGFGCGKWNGFGGKLEKDETMLQCAKRELFEESGMRAEHLEEVGFLSFEFLKDPLKMDVHVFTASQFTGTPTESEEMLPRWFQEKEVPFDEMWADDCHWFPLLFKGAKFSGRFTFLDTETLLHFQLQEVDRL